MYSFYMCCQFYHINKLINHIVCRILVLNLLPQGSQENDSIINLQLTKMCNKTRYYPIIDNQIEKTVVLILMSPNI